ncbi:hypothetical protein E0H73_24745 [Kribbella pittospori]|uniref:Uncharacterized protein n=1 Tax=Kribbella pittospori TaxID=722689 RepID=A0A4R0KFE8_9ACTN|nr:hypothetical protein [Kribbella pittospori]TCC58540.1 hypothetical protein E0H73_24745 [Kribbella pittospori]
MPAKPNPVLGLVLGIIVGYAGIVGGSYAGTRLALTRQVRFDSILTHGLQWLLMLAAIAVIVGLLMVIRSIGAGVMVGAGALMTLAGLVVMLAPIRTAYDVVKLFQVPGSRMLAYMLTDGSALFIGIILLIAGIGRWAGDAKTTRALRGESGGYNPALAPQPQQWGGYPGQQQQPQPTYPGQPQQAQQQDRQQPGGYPGQQPPGNTFPGQQPPR